MAKYNELMRIEEQLGSKASSRASDSVSRSGIRTGGGTSAEGRPPEGGILPPGFEPTSPVRDTGLASLRDLSAPYQAARRATLGYPCSSSVRVHDR